MKIVRVLVWVLCGISFFLPSVSTTPGDYEQKIVHYVALGDSIAGGYGLEHAETESYVGRIAQALEIKYGAVEVTNFGENGLRSDELLEILENPDNEKHDKYLKAIQGADLITLSIGSNDLLQYLSKDFDVEELKEKGDQLFASACDRFQKNIPLVLQRIIENAPQAQLFVNNVYNPCRDISFCLTDKILKNLDEMAENYIIRLNRGFQTQEVKSVFASKSQAQKKQKYILVDVKYAFEKSDKKLINMMISLRSIDPHPNREGHRVIAEQIIPKIQLNK